MPIVLDGANFKQEILDYQGTALVDFWAPWCGPCLAVAPIVEEIAREYENRVKVGKVNTDENMGISSDFGIMSIPTLIVFKDGKPVDKIVGAVAKKTLTSHLDKWLS